MRHLFILFACAAPLGGCILETELCGRGFVETERGGCAPQEAPPPYYSDAGFDLGVDAAPEPEPPTEPETAPPEPPPPPPPPEPEPVFDPWEARDSLLIVDRSSRDSARRTPSSPGFDLDAIVITDEAGALVGTLGFWEAAQINDPFGRNVSRDPAGALGQPDAAGPRELDRYVSLGTEGGFVHYQLELFAPLQAGQVATVTQAQVDDAEARAEIYLCLPGELDLSLCRSLGVAQGTARLVLTP